MYVIQVLLVRKVLKHTLLCSGLSLERFKLIFDKILLFRNNCNKIKFACLNGLSKLNSVSV